MKPSAISRINAFDLLRGWCLVVISSDHLMRFPSLFDPFTGRGLLWVTAAEGFFFISGTLVGMVRGRKMHTEGLKAATRLLWKRAGQLYVASIVLTLGFTFLAQWATSNGLMDVKGGLMDYSSLWQLLWQTLTLQYSYGWTDFLNYYVVFLLLAPGGLWLLRRRKWWVVLALSVIVWLGKGWLGNDILIWYATWQSYFFIGLVFGYHYHDVHAAWRRLSEQSRRGVMRGAVALTAVTVLASFAYTFGTPWFAGRIDVLGDYFRSVKDNGLFTYLFQNNRTGLLRLPLFLLWFGTLFALVRRYETVVLKWVGWLLLPLGRNSLYVYILQGFVAFGVMLLNIPQGFIINTLINAGAIMMYWWAIRKRLLFSIIPR